MLANNVQVSRGQELQADALQGMHWDHVEE